MFDSHVCPASEQVLRGIQNRPPKNFFWLDESLANKFCSVEGEMDRLRIMTTDFNSYSMDEIKAEPQIFIKQEYPQHPIYVKSEVQDYDEVSEQVQTRSRHPFSRSTFCQLILHQRHLKTILFLSLAQTQNS